MYVSFGYHVNTLCVNKLRDMCLGSLTEIISGSRSESVIELRIGQHIEKARNLRVCDTTVEGLASTVVLGAPAKRMRSFSLSVPSMPLEEEMPKRLPEDSFSCVSVDSEIVNQGEATEGRSCQMLGVQHESLGMRICPEALKKHVLLI